MEQTAAAVEAGVAMLLRLAGRGSRPSAELHGGLVPLGLDTLAATRAARSRVYDDVLRDWPTADRQMLAELLERLNTSLDDRARRVGSCPAATNGAEGCA